LPALPSGRIFRRSKETFPATDYAPATGTLIFNIGGTSTGSSRGSISEEQLFRDPNRFLTHREYDREDL